MPVEDCGFFDHKFLHIGILFDYNLGRVVAQEIRFQFGSGPVHSEFQIRRGGQEQEAVFGDHPLLHIGLDDADRARDGSAQVRAVWPDDKRHVGDVQEIKAAADANDPFPVHGVEIQIPVERPDFRDVLDVTDRERHQILKHALRHIRIHRP